MFKTTITLNITKDDAQYCDATINYYNMEKADVVVVEGALIGMLGALNQGAQPG